MALQDKKSVSGLIRTRARELGFDLCGIARSRPLVEHVSRIENWCLSGMNSDMGYLKRNIEKRIDPEILLPGTKSVIVTGLNYYTERKQGGNGVPVISRYAYGVNYHDVIRARLDSLLDYISTISPGAEGKSYVDSAPLLEKAWAREAGLGWPGKHSVLINDKIGSFFFIGIILLNLELAYDTPFREYKCGRCRICIDACPTGAINSDRTVNTRKCIAYLTIESKDPVPVELVPSLEGRVFGCDRCQEVCPWNRHASVNSVKEFQLNPEIEKMTLQDWQNLQEEKFKKLFRRTPVARTRYQVFKSNISLLTTRNP